MSDIVNSDSRDETKPAQKTWATLQGQDWVLSRLVQLANHEGLEQGITLTVGGSVISGTLIGGATYFKEMIELLDAHPVAGPNGDDVKKAAINMYANAIRNYIPPDGTENNLSLPPPAYIHLRDAIWLGMDGRVMFSDGRHWRGRIANIDGYSPGGSKSSRG